MKRFIVTRTVIEVYQVVAESKEAAKKVIADPHSVTVKKETIKEFDYESWIEEGRDQPVKTR